MLSLTRKLSRLHSRVSQLFAHEHGDGVVAEPAARMDGNAGGLVDDDKVFILVDDGQRRVGDRELVAMDARRYKVLIAEDVSSLDRRPIDGDESVGEARGVVGRHVVAKLGSDDVENRPADPTTADVSLRQSIGGRGMRTLRTWN